MGRFFGTRSVIRMRALGAGGLSLSCVAAFSLAFACVDLFHSTNFETLCDVDAKATGCPLAEAQAAPMNFCLWSSSEAHTHAEHACAWLGACSSPFDQNAFGPCMINAVLAYDCTVNPNRTIASGPLHDFWDALWRANSCGDVQSALPHPSSIQCVETGYACVEGLPDLLFQCAGDAAEPESCLIHGLTCRALACATPDESESCDPPNCEGSVLHACGDGGKVDEGYDCQYFGSGTCTALDGSAGCAPSTEDGGGSPCAPTTTVTCDGGVASSCATGILETVACEPLTGKNTCNPTATPSWNLAGACESSATCDAGCRGEAGDTLVGCGNGAEFTTSCNAQGLDGCRGVPIAQSTGYACGAR
jgi:hypothetical protein